MRTLVSNSDNLELVTIRKEDLAGALGLLRDGKMADLSARIAAHLQDPDTRQAFADNPFSAIWF